MFKIEVLRYQGEIPKMLENIMEIPYYNLIKIEAVVNIYVNNIIFFTDDYFPILEFIYQYECWKKQNNNVFEYNSIESEDNPILSFSFFNNICIIDSVWKLIDRPLAIDYQDFLNEMNKCKNLFHLLNTGDG